MLIDVNELTSRLQKSPIKSKKNKPLFFANTADEVKNNYPEEVMSAYTSKERYAKLDIQRTGVNRFGNLGRAYGLSPVFKALKPKIMLDTFDKADTTNTKQNQKRLLYRHLEKKLWEVPMIKRVWKIWLMLILA